MHRTDITPELVLGLRAPTKKFLCPLDSNVYNIDFLSFAITDYDTKNVIFEVSKDRPLAPDLEAWRNDEDSMRKIRYNFSEDVLRLPAIQTSLMFSVGNQPVESFRMIERHYFQDRLIKSYDFDFGFCIPKSTNTWDAVYSVPAIEESLIAEMVASPHETTSDSFYFVGDELIMHNKASYKYIQEDRAQAKRSYDVYNPSKMVAGGAKGGAGGAKGTKFTEPGGAESKEAKSSGGAQAKASAKQTVWSKETDYSNNADYM
uniref:GMP phosphodiesterase delta subunit domain-containing protein n=1 Tax=Octactis speculum TaxID=3111310 RepID=A0A7S2CN91_9STRA|mmetsp:Transcript_38124/g.51590  ORF Transcript_38124/g.51590 Transcript_38124/m.51590 type:complete len:260 (+) Transcript_38124:77-856(+)|eukprot:CAMPEP_0185770044 /NCGR_PEP_ID=MMETSP1174-20130828/57252_1 /TAXON_ID=35687 /ORGANISM="Dictyocha speculum, Strain CCMP1381" /LENGTH=259 /DNA_ID=CAMNT_0028455339 /DNA_START=77 /DNA_END=856 /DNA_ORIENTATION=+